MANPNCFAAAAVGLLVVGGAWAAPLPVFDQARDLDQSITALRAALPGAELQIEVSTVEVGTSQLQGAASSASSLFFTAATTTMQESDVRGGALHSRVDQAVRQAFKRSSISDLSVQFVNKANKVYPYRVATYRVYNPDYLPGRSATLTLSPFASDPTQFGTGWSAQDVDQVLRFMRGPGVNLTLCNNPLCAESRLGVGPLKARRDAAFGSSLTLTASTVSQTGADYQFCGANGAHIHLQMQVLLNKRTAITVFPETRCP